MDERDLSNLDPHKAYCIYPDGSAHEVVPLTSPAGLAQFRDIWKEEYEKIHPRYKKCLN